MENENKPETRKLLNFVCPECSGSQIEEVLINVVNTSKIIDIDTEGNCDYELVESSDGDVGNYQCHDCGYIIKDDQGKNITDCPDLALWLINRGGK